MQIKSQRFINLYEVTCPEHEWLQPVEVEAPTLKTAGVAALEAWKEMWPQLNLQVLRGSQVFHIRKLINSSGQMVDLPAMRRRVEIG
tara:strand:+ start:34 stop:294 length:261 start_codon:yes stop_codon:yes gene_type:complete